MKPIKKCPKCGKFLKVLTDKKFGGTFLSHIYSLSDVFNGRVVCDYTKRIK